MDKGCISFPCLLKWLLVIKHHRRGIKANEHAKRFEEKSFNVNIGFLVHSNLKFSSPVGKLMMDFSSFSFFDGNEM